MDALILIGDTAFLIFLYDVIALRILFFFFEMLTFCQQSSKEVLTSVNGTGIAMLFSAGTFLYVATVHVLPELTGMASPCDSTDQGRSDKMQRSDLILMVFGIISPLLLSQTHSHH